MMLLANNPELYKKLYPEEFKQPIVPDREDIEEFVPESPADFAKMLATMRRMGYSTNEE